MGVNKFIYRGVTKFDISGDTVDAAHLATGYTAHDANGDPVTGTMAAGGGPGVLLATQSLGTISTSSTSETAIGQTISLTGIHTYDILLVATTVDTLVSNRHIATFKLIELTGSTTVRQKNATNVSSPRINMKRSSSDVTTSASSTTDYGIYPKPSSIGSGGTLTLTMYSKYNSTQTGTINGSYTTKVYGIKLVPDDAW